MSRKSLSRKLLLASAGALALTGSAVAADLPPPPPPPPVFTWTGIYLGGQIGYGWGDNTGNVAFATPGGIVGAHSLGGDAQGVIGGGHVGYNLQINNWVIGVEGAIDGTTLSRTALIAAPDNTGATDPNTGLPFPAGSVTGTVRSGFQGSIRGRAGFAWGRLLIYRTGGVAFAGFTSELMISGTDAAGLFFASGSRSSTRVGWTAGGGVAYAINNNWSVMAEYRYSDFGHIRDLPAASAAGLSLSANRHLAQNPVQVGFSYKFDSFAPAPVLARN